MGKTHTRRIESSPPQVPRPPRARASSHTVRCADWSAPSSRCTHRTTHHELTKHRTHSTAQQSKLSSAAEADVQSTGIEYSRTQVDNRNVNVNLLYCTVQYYTDCNVYDEAEWCAQQVHVVVVFVGHEEQLATRERPSGRRAACARWISERGSTRCACASDCATDWATRIRAYKSITLTLHNQYIVQHTDRDTNLNYNACERTAYLWYTIP